MNSPLLSNIFPLVVVWGIWAAMAAAAEPAPLAWPNGKFELVDGDRVTLVGGTFVEREPAFGYLETNLTRLYPARNITFRNLGWSGDTVFGHSRARFGTVEEGFKRLVADVTAVKPSVIVLAYGGNEAFDGPAALPAFLAGYERLLDALAPLKARTALLAPLPLLPAAGQLRDPALHNAVVRQYAEAVRDLAEKRQLLYFEPQGLADTANLSEATNNGADLTAYGYWLTARNWQQAMSVADGDWSAKLEGSFATVKGGEVRDARLTADGGKFSARRGCLSFPRCPEKKVDAEKGLFYLTIPGLSPGRFVLKVDGQEAAVGTSDQWASGIDVPVAADFEQVEQLRTAIAHKNELYFHRWRPQNETYLYLFRKHEQGQNAAEIPQFDPLVAAQEKEIARLRVPVWRTFEITQAPGP